MQKPSDDQAALTSLRLRSRGFLGYLFWILAGLAFLWAANLCAQLAQRWVGLLRALRGYAGFNVPAHGPDYWIIGGVAILCVLLMIVLASAYTAYRVRWSARLTKVWGERNHSALTKVGRLPAAFNERDLKQRFTYLDLLSSSPEWKSSGILRQGDSRSAYCDLSAAILKRIEVDVAARAVTTGLIVGMNRNPILDTLTLLESALELQLHVLTILGKRPTLKVWIELFKRAGASIFLNTYVGREDALYLNLAIRKAALGLEMGSDAVQEAANSLADVDWDEILGGVTIPGLSAVTSFATMSMSVGAFGLRHIGTFIEATANDLLQGVLAGGVLYFHGMSLAADCLAVDREHRASAEMTRTISQSMLVACAPAGRLLRDQVRRMRAFLRGRRQLAFTAARDAAKVGVEKLRDASSAHWESVKGASKLFR